MKRTTLMLLAALLLELGAFAAYIYTVHQRLDTAGPEIMIEEGILELSVNASDEDLLQGVTAQDRRNGDVTDSLIIESVYGIGEDNTATVTYAAFDRSGNVSTQSRRIRYVDYHAPRFELYGSLTFSQGDVEDVIEYVGANDVIEGDIRRRVHATLISDTKSVNEIGSHKVRFQVTNSLGDTSEVVLPVEVFDSEWYIADVELSKYLIYLEKGSSFDPKDYLKSFHVRGDIVDLTRGIPEGVVSGIESNVNTNKAGLYEVTYELSSDINMTTFAGIAKLIVIVTE